MTEEGALSARRLARRGRCAEGAAARAAALLLLRECGVRFDELAALRLRDVLLFADGSVSLRLFRRRRRGVPTYLRLRGQEAAIVAGFCSRLDGGATALVFGGQREGRPLSERGMRMIVRSTAAAMSPAGEGIDSKRWPRVAAG